VVGYLNETDGLAAPRRHYRILDRVLESGEVVEVTRNGRVLRIVPDGKPKTGRLSKLTKPKKTAFKGRFDDLVHIDWSSHWRP
jgi:antitoxin (DNA-binding transcriptional repressor) of toxin-antitoxin stability system